MVLHRIAALCLLLAAAGCGQKGPLYLPGDPNEGRIVLPDELAGQEQDERVEQPGDATDSAAPDDEDGADAARDDRADNERRPGPEHEQGSDEQ